MAGESYSLDEVSALLGVPVADLVRQIEDGAFPGRFLTKDWEMRIPAQDVRRAVDAIRRRPGRAMVPSGATLATNVGSEAGALLDPRAFRDALDDWWSEREGRLLGEIRDLQEREDRRWESVEAVLIEVRDRLDRLHASGPSWTAEVAEWASGVEATPSSPEEIFEELRDLERLLGLEDGRSG